MKETFRKDFVSSRSNLNWQCHNHHYPHHLSLTALAINFRCHVYLCNGTPSGPGEKIVDRTCPNVKKQLQPCCLAKLSVCQSPPYPLQQAKINQKRQSPHIRWLLEYQNLRNLALLIPPFFLNLTKLSDVIAYMLDMSLNLGIEKDDMKTFVALYQFHCSVQCCKVRR